MSARVVCRVRTGVTLSFEIGEKAAYLGRDKVAAVSVPVEGVSRHHARISWDGKSHWLEDLKSTNGTFLNGKAISRERLQHLDVITLGKAADLVFLQQSAAGPVKVKGIVKAAVVPEGSDTPREIAPGEVTLGRAQSCNVVADAPGVSKVHARIERTRDQLVLEDLGSANGTFVNGTRVASAFLNHDDVVSLGGAASFRVVIEVGEIASPASSGRFTASSGAFSAPGKPRFSADWKTRYEWSDSEQNLIEDMRRKLAEEDKRRQAGRVRREVTVQPTAKEAGAAKPPAPKPAAPAAAAAKPPVPAAKPPAPAAPAAAPAAAPPPAAPPAAAPPAPAPPPTASPAAAKPHVAAPPAPAPPKPAPQVPAAAPAPAPVAKSAAPALVTEPAKAPPAPPKPAPPPAVAAPPKPPSPAAPPRPALSGEPTAPAPPRAEPPPAAAPAAPEVRQTAGGRIAQILLSGPDVQLVVVEPGAHDLGRSQEMELRVNNPTVSRRHARIILSDDRGMAYVQDQGGSNGTRLNGKEVERLAALADGDSIGIGSVELRVTLKRG